MPLNITKAVRTLLGTAVFCWLLVSAGCSGTTGSSGGGAILTDHHVDWGMSLLAGGTVGIGQFPAKFSFDVTAAPDCTHDFVAYNTSLTGASGTAANIVAFNNLYSTQGGSGALCSNIGPSVYWSYFTGTGKALTSVVLSIDGSKIAFVENAVGGATLRILKWKAGEGTSAGAPAPVDQNTSGADWSTCTAGNSCMASVAFGNSAQDTRSAPYYDYGSDVLYVGDDSGVMHKFTGVFNGTPTETVVGWPITVNAGQILTPPVYDGLPSGSGNIYVGDDSGRLSFIREVGSTVGTCTPAPCLDTTNLPVGPTGGGSIVDAPIVDSSTGFVFAVNGTDSTNNGTLLQASTDFTTSVVRSDIGGQNSASSAIYGGAFDETYFESSVGSIAGHMYVCGKALNRGDSPAVYQFSFDASGVLITPGTPTNNFTSNDSACSPVSEFYNSATSTDWIFFSIADFAGNAAPLPTLSNCRVGFDATNGNKGCVIGVNVTTAGPAWPPTVFDNAVALPSNTGGSSSGIVVDNGTSAADQTSSIYFSLGLNSVGTGPGIPSCNTTAGVGCAVKLTQSTLN